MILTAQHVPHGGRLRRLRLLVMLLAVVLVSGGTVVASAGTAEAATTLGAPRPSAVATSARRSPGTSSTKAPTRPS